jgi:hypothetical protein
MVCASLWRVVMAKKKQRFSSPWNTKCKYQLFWNDEMQKAKIFTGVFSSIQNVKFFMG